MSRYRSSAAFQRIARALAAAACLAFTILPGSAAAAKRELRLSLNVAESPHDTYGAYARFVRALEAKLGLKVCLVQRKTLREVNDLLVAGNLDAALMSTGGYLELQQRAPGVAQAVALQVARGRPTFQSLIVVPAGSSAAKLTDLEGKRFAFTDDLSLSGKMYPAYLLKLMRRSPDRFFASTILTGSHDASLVAVARGVVDGAAVHSDVFQHFAEQHDPVARRVRVIDRSPEFAGAPVVVSTRLSSDVRVRVHHAFLTLADDREGAAALRDLGIDRFVEPGPGAFDSAQKVFGAIK